MINIGGKIDSIKECMKKKLKITIGLCVAGLVAAVMGMNLMMTATIYGYMRQQNETELELETTQENDVVIGQDYKVKGTTNISKAYISGDRSKLSEKELETLEMAEELLAEIIQDGMSDYEKELAVYDWMVEHIGHDQGALIVIPTSQQSVDEPYGVLKSKTAVCVGYATTFRLFMQMLGIESMVVHDVDFIHTWNLVKLEDEWYITDVYSDAGSNQYRHFNIADESYGLEQTWDHEFFPKAEGTKYNYAKMNHTELKDIYSLPKKMKKLLDDRKSVSAYYGITGESKEDTLQIVNYMMERVMEYAYMQYDEDGSLYLNTSITDGEEGEFILGIFITRNDAQNSTTLTEEEIHKIDGILNEVFE